jgi:hypothetical protein
MKERILMIRMEYSVLKEKMKENECGWSELNRNAVSVRGTSGRFDLEKCSAKKHRSFG